MMVEVMAGQAVTPFGRHRCNAASRFHYNTMKPADAVKSARHSVQTTVLRADLSRACGALQKRANPLFMHLSGLSQRPPDRPARLAPQNLRRPPTKTGASLRKRPFYAAVRLSADSAGQWIHPAISISTLLCRKLAAKASLPKSLPIPERL